MATNNQTTVLELAHDLTPDEQLANQRRIMGLLDKKQDLGTELSSAEAEFKRKKTDIAKRAADVETEINKVRETIKVGREMRNYNCNIIRDRDTRKVSYVAIDGPRAGETLREDDFTQEDWTALLQGSQPDLFDGEEGTLDGPADEDGDDEPQDLRSRASLTDEGPVQPDTENGKVIAGPNTDAYNRENPDSPHQHLSGDADFQPATVGGADDSTGEAGPEDGADLTSAADADADDKGTDDEDDEDDDESGDDDEPVAPTPPAPKRRAARRKDAAQE